MHFKLWQTDLLLSIASIMIQVSKYLTKTNVSLSLSKFSTCVAFLSWFENRVLATQQNSYSISHLLDTVTTHWLDSDCAVTAVNCRQHGDYTAEKVTDGIGVLLCIFSLVCAITAAVKGCGMGPLFVLVSPCFRESVVAKWKLGLSCVV